MAALSKNGTELARLVRVKRVDENEPSLETVLSVRSNGAILKRTRWLGSKDGAWKVWRKFKPFGPETVTLPQSVRSLVENAEFAFASGSQEAVLDGWFALVDKVRRGPRGRS